MLGLSEKVLKLSIQIQNYRDLGEALKGAFAFSFEEFEGGKADSRAFGQLGLGPATGQPVGADPPTNFPHEMDGIPE